MAFLNASVQRVEPSPIKTEVFQIDLIAWELWSSYFLHLEREILIECIIVVDVCRLDSESQYTGINKTE